MTLPSTYQEVEYIEASGSQYINTGYIPNNNTKIYAKFSHNEHTINQCVFGCRGASGTSAFNNQYILWSTPSEYSGDVSQAGALFNNTRDNTSVSAGTKKLDRYTQGTIIEFEYDKNGGYYNNQTWTRSPASGTPNVNMLLMGVLTGTSVEARKFSGKMFSFKIRDSGILVRNMIPCYRKSDSVIGMYDLVNNQFYTNSGSGTFTKGPDVVIPYKLHGAIQTFHYQFEVPYSWEPDASRTLIYYPLTSNLVDQMGNGNTGTMYGTCTYDSTTGIHVTGMSNNYVTGLSNGIANKNTFTMNVWIKNETTSAPRVLLGYNASGASSQCMYVAFESSSGINQLRGVGFFGSSWEYSTIGEIGTDNNWHNLCLVATGTTYQWYIDGVAYGTAVSSSNNMNNYPELQLGWGGSYGSSRSANGYIKDYIVENYAWSAEDITNYYNRSKSKVGL